MRNLLLLTIVMLLLALSGASAQHEVIVVPDRSELDSGQLQSIDDQGDSLSKAVEGLLQQRRATGDTIAMPYATLQKFLPTEISGYRMDEAPSGSSQNMGGFSMSYAEQKWVSSRGPRRERGHIKVTITDFGSTETGWGIMGGPMLAMNISSEDTHQRMRTLKLDVPYTWAIEHYNKDNKEARFTATTRFRYLINVEATNQTEDLSEIVKSITIDLVKKFEGK